jgi:predicted alpha/beta superfamily hydrolase
MLMKSHVAVTIAALLLISCGPKREAVDNQMIVIGRKESIESKILNEVRPYWVYVPPAATQPGAKLPVLYLLDGDAHFHSVSGLVQNLGTGINGTHVVPDMIIVAIPNIDRTKDLTPSHSETMNGEMVEFLKTSGGGDKFLRFISDELIPSIDAKYPTNGYRTLIGHSFGGIAVINALYTIPESFDSYVAIDPSFWWDNLLLVKKGDSIFRTRDMSGKTLFIGQANTLHPGESTNYHFGSIKEYLNVLETNKSSGLRWSYKYYPNDSHGSVPLITEYDGLRFIFEDFNPSFEKVGSEPDQLKKIFDRYRTRPPEHVINDFGYNAMRIGNMDLAMTYFQMNIDSYPSSSSAQSSMGNLWLTKGDSATGLQYYLNALQMDPGNRELRTKVKDLQASPAGTK